MIKQIINKIREAAISVLPIYLLILIKSYMIRGHASTLINNR